jgi:hypothetical protein
MIRRTSALFEAALVSRALAAFTQIINAPSTRKRLLSGRFVFPLREFYHQQSAYCVVPSPVHK